MCWCYFLDEVRVKYKPDADGCPGGAITIKNSLVTHPDHNHAGNASAVEGRKIQQEIRKRARETRDAPKFIVPVAENIGSCSQATLCTLPIILNLKRSARAAWKKVEFRRLKDPVRRKDIVLQEILYPNKTKPFRFVVWLRASRRQNNSFWYSCKFESITEKSALVRRWYFQTLPTLVQSILFDSSYPAQRPMPTSYL